MKKILIAGLLLLGTVKGWAYSIGDFLNTVDKQINFTALDSVQGAYFYDGKNGFSAAGVLTHAVTFSKFFALDVGYYSPYESRDRGAFVYGASLDMGKVIAEAAPDQIAYLKTLLPNGAQRVFSALFIGPYVGRDETRQEVIGGFYTGLELKLF